MQADLSGDLSEESLGLVCFGPESEARCVEVQSRPKARLPSFFFPSVLNVWGN